MKHKNAKPVASKRPAHTTPPSVTCPTCGWKASRYAMKDHKAAHDDKVIKGLARRNNAL